MKIPKIAASMEYMDDDLISNAEEYMRAERKFGWKKWIAVAACMCLLIIVAVQLLGNQQTHSPFLLTAYAKELDGTISVANLKKGDNVPISYLKADNGMSGFVFSYKAYHEDNPLHTIHVSIINDNFASTTMGEDSKPVTQELMTSIDKLELEDKNQYVFYVPNQKEAAPYQLNITMKDKEAETIADTTIVIEQQGENYYARIEAISIYEKPENLDELLKPYQEVLDRLNDEYGYALYMPEDEKYSIYYTYKDMTPEEFEAEMMKEIEEPEIIDNGNWNYQIFPAQ